MLDEIKEITLSENKNREIVTKLKKDYREIYLKYNNSPSDYEGINNTIELQFENIDKLFNAFELAMENNDYSEASKIVKALTDNIGNIGIIIDEASSIILMGKKLIPAKIEDIKKNNDYAMWLKVCKKADCYLLNETLAEYRKRSGSISNHGYAKLIKWHYILFREAEKKGVLSSLFLTFRNLFWGVWKKIRYVKK